jgi:pyruvate,water dikinase
MSALIVFLEEAPEDAAVVGGKAAGLGRLLRAGLPVPPGFALSAEAFREFLRHNALEAEFAALAATAEAGADAQVLDRLRAGAWPAELRAQLGAAYAVLRGRTGGVPVAVRSSATAEDSAAASFAGQHDTLLNISGLDDVLDAVLCCWASLYGATGLHYRRARNVDEELPAMAVVVQALVPAEAAGVAFTVDPVSGDRDLVVIDAAWGLGEGVVSGVVTPDHFAVRKSDGAIERKQLAPKRQQIVAAAGGGTRSEALSGERAATPALSDEQAVEVARLAARVEELSGWPQDVEWARAGGRLYLLQARPVTAFAAPAAPAASPEPEEWVSEFDTDTDPDTVWTAGNVQEVFPDQMSPFGCSITEEWLLRMSQDPAKRMGFKLRNKDPFSAYFYGRPFLNVSTMIETLDQVPFVAADAIKEQFYGQGSELFELPERRFSLGRLYRYLVVTPRLLWFRLRMTADVRRAERIVQGFDRDEAARPIRERSDEELIRTLEEGLAPSTEVAIIHVSGAGLTSTNFDLLRRITRDWLGDESGALHATLCSGLSGVESAQPAYELWDISRLVLASDLLRGAFATREGEEIERRLAALSGADVEEFRRRLAAFLSRHGHRSVMEAEAAAKSWEEDLPTVFVMVRNYLAADESHDPRRVEERQRGEREAATRDALGRLRLVRRLVFRNVVRGAQTWVVMREHTKSLFVRTTHRGRHLSREIARRLVARGLLDDIFDLYYLTWEEVQAFVRGGLSRGEAYQLIQGRRAEEERNRRVVLPETFKGRPKPLRPDGQSLPDGRILRGIAVSPGRVTGRARVILDPRRDGVIEPGEILVAPVTDAGWTPLFIAASGIVVDIGASLSHGSTVAREYGLPAVVNVKHGTRLIRTGQTITVDGSQGVVLLEENDVVGTER